MVCGRLEQLRSGWWGEEFRIVVWKKWRIVVWQEIRPLGRPVEGWGWGPSAHRVQRGGLRVGVLSGHGRLGSHASFSIRSNQPGQMKQVGDREEAGTKLSRATGGRMLVSALLAETGSQVGTERTRPLSGTSTRNPPQRQKVPRLQARPKD